MRVTFHKPEDMQRRLLKEQEEWLEPYVCSKCRSLVSHTGHRCGDLKDESPSK